MHDEMFRQLFGHEETNLAAKQYGTAFTPVQCAQRIELLDYPIDVENIAWNGNRKEKKLNKSTPHIRTSKKDKKVRRIKLLR